MNSPMTKRRIKTSLFFLPMRENTVSLIYDSIRHELVDGILTAMEK